MRIEIDHRLTLSPQPGWNQLVLHLLLTPPNGRTQTVESWSVETAGIGTAGRFADAFGNGVHLVNQRPESEVQVVARGVVVTTDTHGILGKSAGEPVPALYKRVTSLTKAPVTVWGKFRNSKDSRLDVLHALMARVGETLGLAKDDDVQMQATGEQSQSQIQSQGLSNDGDELPPAADYAHLFIGAARALGIPARFVCGYLAPSEGVGGGLHAWAEAFDEKLGWIGFDARHQLCPTERHIRLAAGLDAETALPLRTVPAGDLVQTVVVKGV
jgi:hypothetical protein